MSDLSLQRVGPTLGGTGTAAPFRGDFTGAQVVTDAHGRFAEAARRGTLFTFGVSNTALVAANAIATGVTATAQPVIGIWNPPTSGVNLEILQATINTTTVANTAVAPGGFMWLGSAGQQNITTGSTPFNCKTLTATGSLSKVFSVSTALTGLVGSLSTIRTSTINSINAAGPATAIHQPTAPSFENVDGAWVVPPGGVLVLMNQVSTTTISVSTALIWEEVPALT